MNDASTAVIKYLNIAECCTGSFIFQCPEEISSNTLSEINNIFQTFRGNYNEKKLQYGKISSREGVIHHYIFLKSMSRQYLLLLYKYFYFYYIIQQQLHFLERLYMYCISSILAQKQDLKLRIQKHFTKYK